MSRAAIFAVNANGTSASAPLNRSSRPSTEIARVPRRANSNSGSPRDFARPLSYPATTLKPRCLPWSGDACQQAIHRRTERATALVQDRASGQPTLVGDAFSNPDNRPTLQFIAFSERAPIALPHRVEQQVASRLAPSTLRPMHTRDAMWAMVRTSTATGYGATKRHGAWTLERRLGACGRDCSACWSGGRVECRAAAGL